MKQLKLGLRAKCKVTGFTGIVAGKTEYLNGCIQWLIKPPIDKDGKYVDGQWIDEGQLEVVDDGIIVASSSKPPGGNRHFYNVIGGFTINPATAWHRTRLIEVVLFEGGVSDHWLTGFGWSDPWVRKN